jgi:DNA-binding transcriptional LysR family regulator
LNTLLHINAFLLVARVRSFSGAARELGIAPSVVTKRITRLEEQVGTQLITRSTRGLSLTAAGERLLPQFMRLIAELEETIHGNDAQERGIEGHLRIKAPTTVTSLFLGGLFSEFQLRHPGVSLEIVLLDRSVNPLEEGFDLVVGARPASYPAVVDVPLCPYPLVLCCSPGYLRTRREPEHPTDLVNHNCLTSVLLSTTLLFDGPRGASSVEIHSRFHANDGRVLIEAARRGLGIAVLPRYLAEEDFRSGRLVPVLADYPLTVFWLKALVPSMKMHKPAVRELVNFLKSRMQPRPPWEADGPSP